jgi:hypothetical protein
MVVCLGCVDGGGRPLFLGLVNSKKSVRQAYALLRPQKWIVFDRTFVPKTGSHPSSESIAVYCGRYCHFAVNGELVLNFYNDKLMALVFFPENVEKITDLLETRYEGKFVKTESGAYVLRGSKLPRGVLISESNKFILPNKQSAVVVGHLRQHENIVFIDESIWAELCDWVSRYH